MHALPVISSQPIDIWFSHLGHNYAEDGIEAPVSLIRAVLRSGYRDALPVTEWRLAEYVVLDEPNEFDDTVLATIRYGVHACTSWGGKLEGRRLVWSCYAD